LEIIETPAGRRQLRYRVGANDLGVRRINALTDEVQAQLLAAFGLTEMTRFAPVIGDIASDFKRTLRVGKVDTDASPVLGSRFGIRSIPTIALFKAGDEIARQSGALPKSALLAWLGEHGIVRDAA
jgi:thioredoxin-like negative regulator of GroEL